jgi:hypothetical protein
MSFIEYPLATVTHLMVFGRLDERDAQLLDMDASTFKRISSIQDELYGHQTYPLFISISRDDKPKASEKEQYLMHKSVDRCGPYALFEIEGDSVMTVVDLIVKDSITVDLASLKIFSCVDYSIMTLDLA